MYTYNEFHLLSFRSCIKRVCISSQVTAAGLIGLPALGRVANKHTDIDKIINGFRETSIPRIATSVEGHVGGSSVGEAS